MRFFSLHPPRRPPALIHSRLPPGFGSPLLRPAAKGKLYLTNVSGELASNYTVPINLTTVVDAENFASWKVYVNGAEVRGFVPEYVNGVLKAKFKHGLATFVR